MTSCFCWLGSVGGSLILLAWRGGLPGWVSGYHLWWELACRDGCVEGKGKPLCTMATPPGADCRTIERGGMYVCGQKPGTDLIWSAACTTIPAQRL
jgi:hypothetical protein